MGRTWEVFSWLLATKLPPKITATVIQQVAAEFLFETTTKRRVGWLIDGSSVVDYEPNAAEQIKAKLEALACHGLRFVAFVHPNSLIRVVVLNVAVSGIVFRGFETFREAEGWFRRRCPT